MVARCSIGYHGGNQIMGYNSRGCLWARVLWSLWAPGASVCLTGPHRAPQGTAQWAHEPIGLIGQVESVLGPLGSFEVRWAYRRQKIKSKYREGKQKLSPSLYFCVIRHSLYFWITRCICPVIPPGGGGLNKNIACDAKMQRVTQKYSE